MVRSVSRKFRKVPMFKCSLEAGYQPYLAKRKKKKERKKNVSNKERGHTEPVPGKAQHRGH